MSTTSDSRQTALLFTDIVDSTGIKARLGTAAYTAVLKRHNTIFETAIHDFAGASIIKHTGDGYLAMFPLAEGAIRCALRLEREIKAEAWTGEPINVRAGVHAGTIAVVHIIDRTDIVGSVADIAARIMSLATGGQILLSAEATEQARPAMADDLVHWKDHGLYKLKGVQDPIEIWEVADTVADFYPSPPGALNMAGDRAKIGPYRILEPLGGGGMGEVYRAEQRSPIRREVAIKLIKLGMDTRLVIARFEAERQALAMMDHPHIAKVFDANTDDTGRPYFVMEYVKGKPITEYADQNHLTIHERLELFEQVCHAIQHAHHKGVIHRDLKPSNVLVSTQDGKPFAKVIDFGIAKAISQRLTEKTLYTQHEQFIGTPQYMSPEQADGQLDIDTRTDVYSLGVLLYELLTGTTPFALDELHAAAIDKIVQMIRDVDPPKPSTRLSSNEKTLPTLAASRRTEPKKLGTLVRGELDWIVMKALEKDRARRYETPNSLSDDIKRHLAGRPVVAAPPSVGYRTRKFVRRYRGPLAAVSVVVAALIAGIIGTSLMYLHAESMRRIARQNELEANRARIDAESARTQALNEKNKAEKSFYDASILAIDKSIDESTIEEARQMLVDCPPQYRNWEWGREEYLCNLDLFHLNLYGWAPISSFSPDGRIIAAMGHNGVQLLDAMTGQSIRALAGNMYIASSLKFSPDGNIIAAGGGGKTFRWEDHPFAAPKDTNIHLWNSRSGMILGELHGHTQTVASLAFSPDGKTLVSGGLDGNVIFWDLATLKEIHRLPKSTGEIRSVVFSPDGSLLATAGWNGARTFDVWDAKTFHSLATLRPTGWGTAAVCFSPDGKQLAVGGGDGCIYFYDTVTLKLLRSFRATKYFIWSIAWHPTQPGLIVGSATGAELVSTIDGMAEQLPGIEHEVTAVGFDPTGNYAIVSCFGDSSLWVYDLRRLRPVTTLTAANQFDEPPSISNISLTRDGSMAAAGINASHFVSVWDTASGKELIRIGPHPFWVYSVSFSPDEKRLATTADLGRIWDLATGKCIVLRSPISWMPWGCFSHNGNLFATVEAAGTVRIWNSHTGQMLEALDQHAPPSAYKRPDKATCACFSPDDKILAVSTSGPINLWDVKTGREVSSFGGGIHALMIAFNNDGKLLVSGGVGNNPCVWDVASGELLYRLTGHRQVTRGVAFSPDGTRVVTASADQSLSIWDTVTHRAELSIPAGVDLYSVAFSGDGRVLAAGGANNSIYLYRAFSWKPPDMPLGGNVQDAIDACKARCWNRAERQSSSQSYVTYTVPK